MKHEILRRYLGAWYPILSKYNQKLVYFETHAGRGQHKEGQPGSPIVALDVLLGHRSRDQILAKTNVAFIFLEKFEDSAKSLRKQIETLGQLPTEVSVTIEQHDYAMQVEKIAEAIEAGSLNPAPTFMFVDPYSFVLPVENLRTILEVPKCEIFVNLMWRYLNLALSNKTQSANMNAMFGEGGWEDLHGIDGNDERCDEAIDRLRDRLGARHFWSVKMYDDRMALKYALAHFSNHPKAYVAMKDAVWSIAPHGDMRFRQSDNPDQIILIQTDPDLSPLSKILWDRFAGQQPRVNQIHAVVDESIFRQPHCNTLLRNWVRDGCCAVVDGEKLVLKQNPAISFDRRPD